MKPYTSNEDNFIIANINMPLKDIAKRLGRTYKGVSYRRWYLRKIGATKFVGKEKPTLIDISAPIRPAARAEGCVVEWRGDKVCVLHTVTAYEE